MTVSLKNRIYITGKEVMERWQILEIDFRDYLEKHYVYQRLTDFGEKDTKGYLSAFLPDDTGWEGLMLFSQFSQEAKESRVKKHGVNFDEEPYDEAMDVWADAVLRREQVGAAAENIGLANLVFRIKDILEFEKQHKLLRASDEAVLEPVSVPVNLRNRLFLSYEEVLERWHISWDDLMAYICPQKNEPYLPAISPDGPKLIIEDVVEWSRLPEGKALTFYVKDVLKFEKQKNLVVYDSDGIGDSEEPIDGKERQELGRLREEKKKWDKSIEAAVHATLFCHGKEQGKEITRDKLKDELYQFNLPHTTFEKIWGALRDKNLTKGPGTPPKASK